MRDDRTPAEKLAFTLNWIADNGTCRGLHPAEVRKAAALLVEQERQLVDLRAALAAKHHQVTIKVSSEAGFVKVIRGTVVITDPRIYYGETRVDALMLERADDRWVQHEAKHLVRLAAQDWLRDLDEKAYGALRQALEKEKADAND